MLNDDIARNALEFINSEYVSIYIPSNMVFLCLPFSLFALMNGNEQQMDGKTLEK